MSDFLQLNQGPQGISFATPKPIISEEGIAPIVPRMASIYSEEAMNAVKQSMGTRGTLGSSGYASAMEGAFRHGWGRAMGDVMRERDMFSKWAAIQLDAAMSVPPEEQGSPLDSAFQYGLTGAQLGGSFGGGPGAAIGGAAGALYGLMSNN